MTRRIVHLTPDRLRELAGLAVGCAGCARFEVDAVRRRALDDDERAAEKAAWLSRVLREWGSCGRVALVDGVPVGYVVYAPPAFVPGADEHPTAPVSPDAVLLTTARVAPEHAGRGVGRTLVQAMAADLVERGTVRAVEAFASAGSRPGCLVPAGFLAHVGFHTQRAHPFVPRMRMDLRTAVSWRDEMESALERLLGVVRPAPAPVVQPRNADGPAPREAGTGPDGGTVLR